MGALSIPLSDVPAGRRATVAFIGATVAQLRRLLELGLIAGTVVEPLYTSLSGKTTAFLIRGAVIALRPDTSKNIFVTLERGDTLSRLADREAQL